MYTRSIRIFSVSLWLGTRPLFAIAQIKFHGHVIDRKGRRGTGRVNFNFNRKSLNPSFFFFFHILYVLASRCNYFILSRRVLATGEAIDNCRNFFLSFTRRYLFFSGRYHATADAVHLYSD